MWKVSLVTNPPRASFSHRTLPAQHYRAREETRHRANREAVVEWNRAPFISVISILSVLRWAGPKRASSPPSRWPTAGVPTKRSKRGLFNGNGGALNTSFLQGCVGERLCLFVFQKAAAVKFCFSLIASPSIRSLSSSLDHHSSLEPIHSAR